MTHNVVVITSYWHQVSDKLVKAILSIDTLGLGRWGGDNVVGMLYCYDAMLSFG